ncbi:hypothetical protein BDR26DRAFT_885415 [Obelidium mucronatum]|nr:hypothetical protein BDR26DRAFT_885415 [Obelidium mucronatum]
MTILENEPLQTAQIDEVESLKRKAAEVETAENLDKKAAEDAVAVAAESGSEAKECDDVREVIYPDTEEFYAWLVTGSEAGSFLACHRLKSVDPAIPATLRLIELGVKAVYDPAEDVEEDEAAVSSEEASKGNAGPAEVSTVEVAATDAKTEDEKAEDAKTDEAKKEEDDIEDLKDTVNFAIEDSYCVVLQDFNAEGGATESTAAQEMRQTLARCAENKSWIKIRVSREEPSASEDARVPATVSVFDARKGLIIPKIGCWKWLVDAEAAIE